jgi:hypothetical protein
MVRQGVPLKLRVVLLSIYLSNTKCKIFYNSFESNSFFQGTIDNFISLKLICKLHDRFNELNGIQRDKVQDKNNLWNIVLICLLRVMPCLMRTPV